MTKWVIDSVTPTKSPGFFIVCERRIGHPEVTKNHRVRAENENDAIEQFHRRHGDWQEYWTYDYVCMPSGMTELTDEFKNSLRDKYGRYSTFTVIQLWDESVCFVGYSRRMTVDDQLRDTFRLRRIEAEMRQREAKSAENRRSWEHEVARRNKIAEKWSCHNSELHLFNYYAGSLRDIMHAGSQRRKYKGAE